MVSLTPVAWLSWPVDGAETEDCPSEAGHEARDQRGGSVRGLCPGEVRLGKGPLTEPFGSPAQGQGAGRRGGGEQLSWREDGGVQNGALGTARRMTGSREGSEHPDGRLSSPGVLIM